MVVRVGVAVMIAVERRHADVALPAVHVLVLVARRASVR